MVKCKNSIEKFIIDTVKVHAIEGFTYFVKTQDLKRIVRKFLY